MINTTRILSDSFQGRPCFRLDTNQNHRPDANEPMLVQAGSDGWKPSEKLDTVHRFDMEKGLGFWTDRQISHKEGWFWDRQEVIDRPKNGTIEADEVSTSAFRRLGTGLHGSSNSFELGSEIVRDSDGALFLDEHSRTYPSRRIIGQGDIRDMENYRQDDSNWLVPNQSKPVLIGAVDGPIHLGSEPVTITIPLTGGTA